MQSQKYHGYDVWGHAILEQEGILQAERYAASGTITLGGKLIEASGVLGRFENEDEAELAGLGWARAWVDAHR
jgi:lipid-binding SYLF domain-containing protein